jgi:hypothetical protein
MKLAQLSLRDLLWFVLTVALCLGWRLDHRAIRLASEQAVAELEGQAAVLEARIRSNEAWEDATRPVNGPPSTLPRP